jgi:hypothetical protein
VIRSMLPSTRGSPRSFQREGRQGRRGPVRELCQGILSAWAALNRKLPCSGIEGRAAEVPVCWRRRRNALARSAGVHGPVLPSGVMSISPMCRRQSRGHELASIAPSRRHPMPASSTPTQRQPAPARTGPSSYLFKLMSRRLVPQECPTPDFAPRPLRCIRGLRRSHPRNRRPSRPHLEPRPRRRRWRR